ncbi:MAG: hypothetical protein DSY66_01230 [Persephonella sp.]|nr:MAG: hypothetical protein DSY66_01230 [Persephonella sp.]
MKKYNFKNLNVIYTEKEDGNMKDENIRNRFLKSIDLKYIYLPKQNHTNIVAPFVNMSGEADGLYTDLKNIPIGVLTADCMAVVITDFKGLVVLHAGWKGLFSGIIENGTKYFKEKKNLFAFISPSIKSCCFEVRKDFIEKMKEFNIDEKYLIKKNGKFYFSLQDLAIDKLKKEGVKDIHLEDICSKCDNRVYSFRNGDIENRILTLAYLS